MRITTERLPARAAIGIAVIGCLLLGFGPVRADSLHISVCASMTDAIEELAADFSTLHPEHTIRINIGPSGALAKQIEQGAPADLFISANSDWMDYLVEKKLIGQSSRTVLARNRLVFVSRQQRPNLSPDSLTSLDRIAIGNPAHVPAGQYAKLALEKLGLYDGLRDQQKLVLAKDVRQALIYADRGIDDGAFVYATDARLSRNTTVHFTVDSALHAPISYALGLTAGALDNSLALDFHDYLKGPESAAVLSRYGFEQAPASDRPPDF